MPSGVFFFTPKQAVLKNKIINVSNGPVVGKRVLN
jgi:hypothetical protein